MTPTTGHARHKLDAIIHSPVRFSIVAALVGVDEAEFGHVRDAIAVSDPVSSKPAYLLEDAAYLKVRKGHIGRRPRTWLALTKNGRQAYDQHLAAIRTITNGQTG